MMSQWSPSRPRPVPSEPLMPRDVLALAASDSLLVMRRVDLQVEGLDHIPATGPVMIAARHYHHLYDGPALIIGS